MDKSKYLKGLPTRRLNNEFLFLFLEYFYAILNLKNFLDQPIPPLKLCKMIMGIIKKNIDKNSLIKQSFCKLNRIKKVFKKAPKGMQAHAHC